MSDANRCHLILWLRKWLKIEDLGELGRLDLEVHNERLTKIDFDGP